MQPHTHQPPVAAEILTRIKAEFFDLPGLRLTLGQIQRLWDLDQATTEAAVHELVCAEFLARTRDGTFVRRSTLAMGHVRVSGRYGAA